ncbi:hypothetical protein M441DRAFT_189193 [Trichoderma asperellum CBS 433.97]|uniref:Secreted protein n=1 Tax=Trichoderma asperellum (strain ATCC 204424 / CBS 433.97 / NBRC 101777) TaxID=1042311 RepID=A0A2T3ZEX5_TRIA4|nr:hypothetical protein M441DRAFT_189193 [Trichoderma asperellum CBS 433.97]PTB43362.1 hypothetical protein M441DRAFT_189193 [Trichoderma asperellum CBS 433.97]
MTLPLPLLSALLLCGLKPVLHEACNTLDPPCVCTRSTHRRAFEGVLAPVAPSNPPSGLRRRAPCTGTCCRSMHGGTSSFQRLVVRCWISVMVPTASALAAALRAGAGTRYVAVPGPSTALPRTAAPAFGRPPPGLRYRYFRHT